MTASQAASSHSERLDTAMDWASKIVLDTLTDHDARAVEAWLAEHADNRAMLDEALAAFGAPETALAGYIVQDIHARAQKSSIVAIFRQKMENWGFGGWQPIALAASVMVAVAIGLSYQGFAPQTLPTERTVYTANSADERVDLSDGTQIAVARGGRVSVALDGRQRHVTLALSEAHFAVARDENRPFIIDTPAGEVRVLGTEFNVTSWNGGVSVRVFEGLVQWQAKDSASPIFLHAGEGVTTTLSGELNAFVFNPEEAQDWQTGWVNADHMMLGELIAKMNRYSQNTISLSEQSLSTLPLTGRLQLSQTEATLQTIAALYDLSIERTPEGVQLSPR